MPNEAAHQQRIQRNREHDRKRRANQPWRAWYKSKGWQTKRSRQLSEHPLCERCQAQGRIVAATVVNHLTPHRGDKELFWHGKLQSLCKPCHDGPTQSEERTIGQYTFDADGWPTKVKPYGTEP